MSEHDDEVTGQVQERLSLIYSGLVSACAALPIPITLPVGAVSPGDMVPAVRRVGQIVAEQVIPEEQKGQLGMATVLWLAAMDLYGLLLLEFEASRASAALGILLMAGHELHDLAHWLMDNSG
ncbi:hypothetical protein [Streptomyces sp. NPDC088182]|uniref:hypothetical protein n=1 Tax=Streptomyces sp. NPDC088182 TaxID=3365838 RepID=UPI003803F1B7